MAKLEYQVTELTKLIQTTYDQQGCGYPTHAPAFIWRNTLGAVLRTYDLPYWAAVSASTGRDSLLIMHRSKDDVHRITIGLNGRDSELCQIEKLITQLKEAHHVEAH